MDKWRSILILQKGAKLLLGIICCLFISGCMTVTPDLPDEIKLGKRLSETKITSALGPAGLNKRFIVFELSSHTRESLKSGGLDYINQLPSIPKKRANITPPKVYNAEGYTNEEGTYTPPMTGPWTEPFLNWESAPIPKDKRWFHNASAFERAADKSAFETTLESYFGGFVQDREIIPFASIIPAEWKTLYYQAAQNPNSLLAYGGYRASNLVLISPDMGLVFYLYRA